IFGGNGSATPGPRDLHQEAPYSDEIAGLIDDEVRRLVDHAHDRARFILTTHRATLDRLAGALVERESLDEGELAEVFGELDKGAGIENVPVLDATRPGDRFVGRVDGRAVGVP